MVLAVEPQQQRVAAELEQATAARIRDREHRLEHAANRVSDLLGTDPAFFGERFGQLREAGYVDKRRCAFARPCPLVRVGREMLDQHPRHVRTRALGDGVGPTRQLRGRRTDRRPSCRCAFEAISACAHCPIDSTLGCMRLHTRANMHTKRPTLHRISRNKSASEHLYIIATDCARRRLNVSVCVEKRWLRTTWGDPSRRDNPPAPPSVCRKILHL